MFGVEQVEFSFDLNVGALLSPVALLVLAWLLKRARDAVIGHMDVKLNEGRELADKRHAENKKAIEAILAKVTDTNGKVAEHDRAITTLQAETRMLTQLFPRENKT